MNESKHEPIIGLEIHMELKTNSKMFCGCRADWFGQEPNTLTCPVCLGLPGALPVPNKKAVEWCVMLGLALGCEIPLFSKFDRKNYFYPDLPKGYQISQYDQPLAVNGWLEIKSPTKTTGDEDTSDGGEATTSTPPRWRDRKRIRIRRVHMEEDTGKLLHAEVDGQKCTLIDFNRSGVPLVEIVTEPDIRSSEEARIFLKKLHQIIRYIGISDADMEKGSMRLEPNISVRELKSAQNTSEVTRLPAGRQGRGSSDGEGIKEDLPNYKVEVKNINSFNFAKKAIDYEISRHIKLLNNNEIPPQETRGWDEKKGITYSQRSKEEAHDYRYFPEPDIPPIRWTESQISQLKSQIPELPDQKVHRFMAEFSLSEYDATILADIQETAKYFENALSITPGVSLGLSRGSRITPKTIANWIINKRADITKTTPEELVKLISQKSQVVQMDEKELEAIIKKVLSANPKAVSDYKSGKEQSLMFLLGQVIRETKGKANAEQVKQKLVQLLKYPGV
ncbi:Asp-tRNA(Asn)/Glu-tRNA(Gln) amidotransferase subunit GatB [Candidatus Gottesmanbacteria bacterium]|nr:Asp-tRNA(Asn)/Glu-tRNA(Gln) amidotransferase subunit GatB [Candidatus Gottesmanbacteria bacterium]